MNSLTLKSIVLFFFITMAAGAQDFILGNVSVAELEQKSHPSDPDAPAAILYSKGKTYFEYVGYWVIITEVEQRIKIYNEDGYDYGRKSVISFSEEQNKIFTDAITYNLEDGKIVKTPLDAQGEFSHRKNDFVEEREIVMPNVKAGSVIEYRYKTMTLYYPQLKGWYFQDFIPINQTSYTISIPSYFTYNSILSGDIQVNQTNQGVTRHDGYNQSTVVYSASNVKSIREEPFVHNINNYRSRLKLELAALTSFAAETTHYATSWKALVKSIYEDKDFGGQMEFMPFFKRETRDLLTEGMTPIQKTEAIFSYVQSRMTWNENYGYICELGVKEAYKRNTGNVADINLILVNMLKLAGLNSYPVLVSTRLHGIATYPSLMAFNYVVAAVQADGRILLLDATDKNSYPDVLPQRALNWVGRMVKEDGTATEIDIMPKKASKNKINIIAGISEDGTVTGRVNRQYFDNAALEFRGLYRQAGKEKYTEALEKVNNGLFVDNLKVINENELAKPVAEDFTFTYKNASEIINGRIYFRPMLFFDDEENPFQQETRLYPIDFDYPFENRYSITINLPGEYTVESSPEPISIVFGESLLTFKYNIEVRDNQLQFNIVFQVNHPYIAKDNYTALKDFFRQMIEKQNEKIVLKKT